MATKKTEKKSVKTEQKKEAAAKKAPKAEAKKAVEAKKEAVAPKEVKAPKVVASIRYIDKVNAPYYFRKNKDALDVFLKEKKYGFWTLLISKEGTQYTFLRKASKTENEFVKSVRANYQDPSKARIGVVVNGKNVSIKEIKGHNTRCM